MNSKIKINIMTEVFLHLELKLMVLKWTLRIQMIDLDKGKKVIAKDLLKTKLKPQFYLK